MTSTNLAENGTHGGAIVLMGYVRLPQAVNSFQNYRIVVTTFYLILIISALVLLVGARILCG
jgi:hypothetical protein